MTAADAFVQVLVGAVAIGLVVGGGWLAHALGFHWLFGTAAGLLLDIILLAAWVVWVASILGGSNE